MEKSKMKVSLALAAFIIAGVSTPAETQEQSFNRIASGNMVAAFEMFWPKRDATAVAERTGALAELMTGSKVHTDDLYEEIERGDGKQRVRVKELGGAPSLTFAYLPQYDEIRLANLELLSMVEVKDKVDEAQAIDIAFTALKKMAVKGLINANDFDRSVAQVGYRKVAGGTIEGVQEYEHIVEYRVTFRRMLNGIELANSGVRIGVHAGGELSSLRVGGVDVARKISGKTSLPIEQGNILTRVVTKDTIEARFESQQPKGAEARVAYSKLMYVMPEDTQRAVVAPSEVFAYSLAFPADEGAEAISRRQIVGFDVTDSKAPMRNYTAPTSGKSEDSVRTH